MRSQSAQGRCVCMCARMCCICVVVCIYAYRFHVLSLSLTHRHKTHPNTQHIHVYTGDWLELKGKSGRVWAAVRPFMLGFRASILSCWCRCDSCWWLMVDDNWRWLIACEGLEGLEVQYPTPQRTNTVKTAKLYDKQCHPTTFKSANRSSSSAARPPPTMSLTNTGTVGSLLLNWWASEPGHQLVHLVPCHSLLYDMYRCVKRSPFAGHA